MILIKVLYLHGDLKSYGNKFKLNASNAKECVNALCCQLKGFRKRIRDGEFRIIRGKYKKKKYLDESELDFVDNCEEYHLIPVPNGSKKSGLLKTILGVALLFTGFAAVSAAGGWASASLFAKQMVVLGAGMVLNGVSQMMSPSPSLDGGTSENAATKQSYIFSSGVNVGEEGNIIPVVYGKFWVGSLVLSAGMKPVNTIQDAEE